MANCSTADKACKVAAGKGAVVVCTVGVVTVRLGKETGVIATGVEGELGAKLQLAIKLLKKIRKNKIIYLG